MKKSPWLYMFHWLLLIALLSTSLQTATRAATTPKAIDVGDRAPSFALKDQNGVEFSLAAMIKKGPVAVVFVRSVEWCVYCQLQTVQISENLKGIQASGGQVVIISYDAPEKIKRFVQRRKLIVPILSDADSKTIDAYAMRALQGRGDQIGSAQHGAFVIAKSGRVSSKPLLTTFDGQTAVDALANALKDANKTKPE